jgi:AhpD family alkylhydroperoxidase
MLRDINEPTRQLREHIGDVYAGFAQMHRAALADGALSTKFKELVALAIGIAEECDGCIASHARGAARNGATPSEVAETIGVTILMQGGPGTIYGPRAWDAYQEFAAKYQQPAVEI